MGRPASDGASESRTARWSYPLLTEPKAGWNRQTARGEGPAACSRWSTINHGPGIPFDPLHRSFRDADRGRAGSLGGPTGTDARREVGVLVCCFGSCSSYVCRPGFVAKFVEPMDATSCRVAWREKVFAATASSMSMSVRARARAMRAADSTQAGRR